MESKTSLDKLEELLKVFETSLTMKIVEKIRKFPSIINYATSYSRYTGDTAQRLRRMIYFSILFSCNEEKAKEVKIKKRIIKISR